MHFRLRTKGELLFFVSVPADGCEGGREDLRYKEMAFLLGRGVVESEAVTKRWFIVFMLVLTIFVTVFMLFFLLLYQNPEKAGQNYRVLWRYDLFPE